MAISQEMINQLSEPIQEKSNPNNRVKYLHLRKDIILNETQGYLTFDRKTFNGKNHIVSRFGEQLGDDHRISFDAVTVAYKQNESGDLDLALVFKSPNDEYRKSVGRNLADVVLNRYLNMPNKAYQSYHTDHYGFHALILTIPVADFIGDATFSILPPNKLGKLTVCELRNSLVTQFIKENVYGMLAAMANYNHNGGSIFMPTYKFD